MTLTRFPRHLLIALLAGPFASCATTATDTPAAHQASTAKVAAEMNTTVKTWLASLDPAQKAKACYGFGDAERKNWHFIPKTRNGLPLKEMTEPQRALVRPMLKSALSERGLGQLDSIMTVLEPYLKENEPPERKEMRQPLGYFVTVFGEPSATAPWSWRFEGHHFTITFTVMGDAVTATPNFYGTNPGTVPSGPNKGLSVLGREETDGRAFLKSLSPEHHDKALLKEKTPADVILMPGKDAAELAPLGIGFGELTKEEQNTLRQLLALHANRLRNDLAEADLKRVADAGWDKVFFAWIGSDQPGQGHYYRIQGPTFVIEYDNTQNNANHVHCLWRDRQHDFGGDLLKAHYEESHASPSAK